MQRVCMRCRIAELVFHIRCLAVDFDMTAITMQDGKEDALFRLSAAASVVFISCPKSSSCRCSVPAVQAE